MSTPIYTGKEGRFSSALSSVATGLGLRKNIVGTVDKNKKPTERKPEIKNTGAKIITKTSIMPNIPTASSMPSQSLTNQTGPSKSPKNKRKSRSSSPSKASIKPKGTLAKEGDSGGSSKQLKLSRSRSKDRKVNTSSGQKLVRNKKIVVKKKVSSHPRASSSTLSGSKTKSKSGNSLASGSIKRKTKPKKKRALTIVSTVAKSPPSSQETCDQSKNELDTNKNCEILEEKKITSTDGRIYSRAPLENALIEALRTTNVDPDDTLRVSGGSVTEAILRSSSARRNIYNQPCIFGTKDIPNVPYYSPSVPDTLNQYNWYNDITKNVDVDNGDIDLRALSSKLPKLKKSSGHNNQNSKRGNTNSNGSPSASSTGSRETPIGTSNTQRDNPKTSKEDEDPNKKKKDTNDRKDESNGRSSSSANRKRKLTEDNSAKVSNENLAAAADGPSTSAQSAEDEQDKEDEDKDAKKKKNRCAECRKKVGLTGFQCRCGGLYCAVHRYSDKHNCTFNYREHGAQEIRRNNPVVVGEKIQKI